MDGHTLSHLESSELLLVGEASSSNVHVVASVEVSGVADARP